jgi:hypothetical protein
MEIIMNPKSALFLSGTLTAFVVAVLFGVVSKVTSAPEAAVNSPVQAVVQQVDTATPEQPTALPSPTMQAAITVGPEQAATLAAEAINRQDVYSVETSTYNGTEAYKVVFSSGDIVYIGLDAQVLAKTKLQPVVVSVPATKRPKHNTNRGNSGNSGSNGDSGERSDGEHEGGD